MWQPLQRRRHGPIGVDLGSRTVKLLQFNAEGTKVMAASRWDLPAGKKLAPEEHDRQLVEAIARSREGREFRGRDAVVCLGARELFVQNIRVPKQSSEALEKTVRQEAASRIPFAVEEAEIRFLEAEDVRQGDTSKREVILLACHRPVLDRTLGVIEQAGLRPVAVDVEPLALLRCYSRQFRRDQDKEQRAVFVHLGASNAAVIIARGAEAVFVKYVDVGGRHLDEAVAKNLKMNFNDAVSLRRHNGDRRADQQDPEVARSVAESIRPLLDKLIGEISLCIRYHSVTFRGHQLSRLVLGGGEASTALLESLQSRIELPCELGEPLRSFEPNIVTGRKVQWDLAAGLALRQIA